MISSLQAILKPLNPRRYLAMVLGMALVCGAGFAMLNYVSNDFGLWRHRDKTRIWALEKTSKYLLAQRYVPENFDAIMIGSSVSANLDTRKIKGFRVYNLSMSGGNITETGAAARKYIEAEGEKRLLIVSLYPYLTKNSGIKGFQIDDSEVTGSVFSMIPVNVWISKIQHITGTGSRDFEESEAGWNNFNSSSPVEDVEKVAENLRQELKNYRAGGKPVSKESIVDPGAAEELRALLELAREKGIRIAAYYHPDFGPRHDLVRANGSWAIYQAEMEKLFRPGEIILDMNGPEFDGLRRDMKAYYDRAHLSETGTGAVLDALNGAFSEAGLVKQAAIGQDPR